MTVGLTLGKLVPDAAPRDATLQLSAVPTPSLIPGWMTTHILRAQLSTLGGQSPEAALAPSYPCFLFSAPQRNALA